MNDLATIPEMKGIEAARVQGIIDAFLPHYNGAIALVEQSKAVKVTDPSDVDGIEQARALRLALRKHRCAAENVKESEKDFYRRVGNGIQGIFNRIKGICEPEEERLANMEKIAERMQAERKARLASDRLVELRKYGVGVESSAMDLGNLPAADWDAYLSGTKAAYEKRLADAARAEEERLQAEFERAEREAELAAENARLAAEAAAARKEAEAAAKAAREEAAKVEAARQAELTAIRQEQAKKQAEADALARKEREAAAKKAAEEKAARDKAEAEALALRKEAQERTKRDFLRAEAECEAKEMAERKAREEAARQAAAPDVEKCRAYVKALMAVPVPTVSDKDSQIFLKFAVKTINELYEEFERM